MSKQFMEDAHGRQVPVSMIKKFDLKRNDLVCSIMSRAFAERERLAEFKQQVWEEIQAFVDESAKDSGAKKLGGKKGNITLTSFDGRYKLIVAVNDGILFNEKLQIAKQLIDECIGKWSKNARPELKVLVDDAFNVGKNGLVSTGKVLGLRRLNITDATWRRAMDAITESIQVVSSKTYMRFYERQEDESYKQIPLDVASL
ncbi:DUF3164 family protein [Treponema socranskii subsp. buccale]|uniref:DUF3164 family protein n=1 Tax=Treponema socranskii TaxID=53419 RepID=UPI0020A4EC09|nr:DUF3164 family protein [Treponema socranskii]UTD02518.1 DUF3164 family protein [Treponema socranskii subsp. buccale]